MKNRTYLKIISCILIQTFLVLDICWAAAGQDIIRNVNDATLSPSLTINNVDLELIFSDAVDTDFVLNGMQIHLDHDFKIKHDMSGGARGSVTPISAEINSITQDGNVSEIGAVPIIPPPKQGLDLPSSGSGADLTPIGVVQGSEEELEKNQKITFAGVPVVDIRGKEGGYSITAHEATNLGLDADETAKLVVSITQFTRYYSDARWHGFREINLILTDDPYGLFRVYDTDNTILGLNVRAVPDLIKLKRECKPLFDELIKACLTHEGGIKGHGTKTPLEEQDIDFLNMSSMQIMEILLTAILHERWPLSVNRRGTPPSDQWKMLANVIWANLVSIGKDPQLAGPDRIRWTESTANIGLAAEHGARGVAVVLWFITEFRQLKTVSNQQFFHMPVEQHLAENFAFLEKQKITHEYVFSEMQKVREQYAAATRSKRSVLASALTSMATVLLTVLTAMPSLSWGADAAVQNPGFLGVNFTALVLVLSVLFIGNLVWNILPIYKTVEQRTVQLVNKAINKKNPRDLMKYYHSANISDKVKIVSIAAQGLKGKEGKVNLELFQDFFLDGLNEQADSITQDLQNKVKDLFKKSIELRVNDREMEAILNEVTLETGLRFPDSSKAELAQRLVQIINSLSTVGNLNADAFIQAIGKYQDLDSFFQSQKKSQEQVLFNNILKQIIITKETQNPELSKIINQAMKQVNVYHPGMFPEIFILVGRLALEGNLHNQGVFVQQAKSMAPLAMVMNQEQMRALHNAILNLLKDGYKNPDSVKMDLVAAEFEKAGLDKKMKRPALNLAAAVMYSPNSMDINNGKLIDTPLSEIGDNIRAHSLAEAISSEHNVFSELSKSDKASKAKVKQIINNLPETLTNQMALGLMFENISTIVSKELNNGKVKDSSQTSAQLLLVNSLGRGVLLNDQQAIQNELSKAVIENKLGELRYAATVGLKTIAEANGGTGDMIQLVEDYLRSSPNISIDSRANLEAVINVEVSAPRQEREFAKFSLGALDQKLAAKAAYVSSGRDSSFSLITDHRNKTVQEVKAQISELSFKLKNMTMELMGTNRKILDSAI